MEQDLNFKYLGVLSIAFIVVVGVYILKRWPADKRGTFSEHVAKHRSAFIIFALSLTLSTFLYYAFLWFWVGPHLDVSIFYYWGLLIAFIPQLIFTWIPADDGLNKLAHTATASLVGIMMPVLVVIILLSSTALSLISITLGWIFVISSVAGLVAYMIKKANIRHLLLYEITYFVYFWSLINIFAYS